MSITHKQTYSVTSDQGGSPLQGIQSEVGATEIAGDITVGASVTNQALTLSFTAANIQSIFLVSDKGMTIKGNSTSSPAYTIVLKPGSPLVWSISQGYYTNPMNTNTTVWYLTTTAASRLQYKLLS